jgi:hypothetical protein
MLMLAKKATDRCTPSRQGSCAINERGRLTRVVLWPSGGVHASPGRGGHYVEGIGYPSLMAEEGSPSQTERAPLLLAFGHRAGRVAALVRAQPILIARLIVAPREAIHAVGAFLHLAPDARCAAAPAIW